MDDEDCHVVRCENAFLRGALRATLSELKRRTIGTGDSITDAVAEHAQYILNNTGDKDARKIPVQKTSSQQVR